MKTDRTTRVRQLDADELRAQLDAFEERYGHDSAQLTEAFRDEDGVLRESDDLFRWAQLYEAWRAVGGSDS